MEIVSKVIRAVEGFMDGLLHGGSASRGNVLLWAIILLGILVLAAIVILIVRAVGDSGSGSGREPPPPEPETSGDFGPRLRRIKARAETLRDVSLEIAGQSPGREMEAINSPRDDVLAAWEGLRRVVIEACAAEKGAPGPGTGVSEAIGELENLKVIDRDISFLVSELNELGREIHVMGGAMPSREDAEMYAALARAVSNRIGSLPVSVPPARAPRPATRVGGSFPRPERGQPAAQLAGIEGMVAGKRFPIEVEQFRMGRNYGNELCLAGDEFVSGEHAVIMYQNGNLFLSDRESRNGTFLNGLRVMDKAVLMHCGDTIRLGNSLLRLYEGLAAAGTGKADEAEPPVL